MKNESNVDVQYIMWLCTLLSIHCYIESIRIGPVELSEFSISPATGPLNRFQTEEATVPLFQRLQTFTLIALTQLSSAKERTVLQSTVAKKTYSCLFSMSSVG